MNNGITWVILTDGNYIKIMFNTASGGELKTLRDGDFEHTSEIAYKMVTRERALAREQTSTVNREQELGFFLHLLAEFLIAQQQNNAYRNLVLVAPGDIVDRISRHFPETIKNRISATVRDDYLTLTQDKIQERLAGKV